MVPIRPAHPKITEELPPEELANKLARYYVEMVGYSKKLEETIKCYEEEADELN